MPYIKQPLRNQVEGEIDALLDELYTVPDDQIAGVLNYTFSKILLQIYGANPNYRQCNEMVGILECAKLELYRHRIGPYEDEKIQSNGDL